MYKRTTEEQLYSVHYNIHLYHILPVITYIVVHVFDNLCI